MGTLIKNKSLDIEFTVEEIYQSELEIYEREMSRYLIESDSSMQEESIIVSAIVYGGIDVGWIPEDVLAKNDVPKSKPAKVAFLAARIAEIINTSKELPEDFLLDYVVPEILQGDLEKYEKVRGALVKNIDLSFYEMALANSLLVKASIRTGWIPENVMTEDKIEKSKPYLIKYLANVITEALTDARTIPSE